MTSSARHLVRYNPSRPTQRPTTLGELAVLQKHHQFIRDSNEEDAKAGGPTSQTVAWEDKLAESWYNKLFREYALIDLTYYKTGNFALRWRVEEEVLDRRGELTCGSLHCKYHRPSISPDDSVIDEDQDEAPLVPKELTPYQLNFRYEEQGKIKQALVKVVLCDRCARKLSWKKDREKSEASREKQEDKARGEAEAEQQTNGLHIRGAARLRGNEERHQNKSRDRSASPERRRHDRGEQYREHRIQRRHTHSPESERRRKDHDYRQHHNERDR